MCGIFLYYKVNGGISNLTIIKLILKGLAKLSHRGNDSAGLAVQTNDSDHYILKATGDVKEFYSFVKSTDLTFEEDDLNKPSLNGWKDINFSMEKYSSNDKAKRDISTIGMGHTRWATHGEVNIQNTHPQTIDDKFIIVHNGTLKNFRELKEYLKGKGQNFKSDTDTECAALLAAYIHDQIVEKTSFPQLILLVSEFLEGHNAFIFMSKYFPHEIIGLMKGTPLILGIKYKGMSNSNSSNSEEDDERLEDMEIEEMYLSSSPRSFIEYTNRAIYLEKGDLIHISHKKYKIYNCNTNEGLTPVFRKISILDKESHDTQGIVSNNFMLNEIFQQPKTALKSMEGRINFETNTVEIEGLNDILKKRKGLSRIIMIGCGTSFNSALAVKNLYERLLSIPIQIEISSDFLDREPPITESDTVFFISQSGETADTHLALEYCKKKGALCIGITNTLHSTIFKGVHFNIPINAGIEISVASTKAYTSQFITLVLIALEMCKSKDIEIMKIKDKIIKDLQQLPGQISEILDMTDNIEKFCLENFKEVTKMIILGRNVHYSTCLEASLKIKELCYIQSEGILSGELKHGPLALVDEKLVCIQIVMDDSVFKKSLLAFHEIKTRKGSPLIICTESIRKEFEGERQCIVIPKTTEYLQGVLAIIPFQLISYFIAKQRGLNIDHPRNLAKSVTTE